MTKLSLRPAGVGSDGSPGNRWNLQEEHYDDAGKLQHSNVVSFGSKSELEAELERLDFSNLDKQRLFDGETLTLWSG